MRMLTARQREVLEVIGEYIAEKGYPPSIRDLMPRLGISSLRGVTIHLQALEKKGWIERERTSRSIRLNSPAEKPSALSIPLLGTIAAGTPLLAVENVESYIPLPAELSGHSGEMFALKVKGDSMTGDHILDGDIIVVRSQNSAEQGEIVAALIEDEATVKRLDIQARPARLLPSNPNYSPVELSSENARIRIIHRIIGVKNRIQARDFQDAVDSTAALDEIDTPANRLQLLCRR